jgi:hypothetical protein
MANNLTKTHGDANPVFALDQLNGSGASTTGTPVQVAGPKLDFFGMDLGGDPSAQMSTGGAIEAVLRCIGQLATVHMYQVEASASANNMSIAVYPTAAWAAADLQAAIRALGTVNGYALTGALVTNNGLKLA